MNCKKIEILLVEDNPDDIELTKEALKESKMNNTLHTVTDGEMAMQYLRKAGDFSGVATPDLIILDLNLPKKDGREVLKEIKEDKTLSIIPVVILTTSNAEEDVLATYKLHANCYITKPIDFNQFIKVVQSIEDFWFQIVKLPKEY